MPWVLQFYPPLCVSNFAKVQFSCLLPTHYPIRINLIKIMGEGFFYVALAIPQPTLKEPTPRSFK